MTASFAANYVRSFAFGELNLGVNTYSSSEFTYDTSGITRTGAHTTVAAQLQWTPPGSGMTFGLWGRNLTNRAVINTIIPAQTAPVVAFAPPREIGISATYSY